MPSCQSSECNDVAQGYEDYPSQQMLYTPQNPMTYQSSQFVSPAYGSPQRPVSVFPNLIQGDAGASSDSLSTMPVEPTPYSSSPQYFEPSPPTAVPAMPGEHMRPTSPVPGAPMGLPPLPTPPMAAPGHSSWQPGTNFNSNQQRNARPAVVSNPALRSGSRYGIASPSVESSQIAPPSAPMASGALTNTLVNNNNLQTLPQTTNSGIAAGRYGQPGSPATSPTSRVPVAFVSQARVLPKSTGSSTSYRSGRSMPPVVNSSPAGFQATQLPMMPDYSTMPGEPLRSTP